MRQLYPEVEHLKSEVEKKICRRLKSPVDFDFLSLKVSECINEHISTSTIKRIWGYIPTAHTPRFSTLSILARYLGYSDWDNYCSFLRQEKNIESTFFTEKSILSQDLNEGDLLKIGWNPNRFCTLKYLGENQFVVVESQNSKIKSGDTFTACQFNMNQPLVITDLKQCNSDSKNDENISYIAGYQTGLTFLSVIK